MVVVGDEWTCVLEPMMPEFRFLAATEFDFSRAPIYRKTASLSKANVEVSRRVQDVITLIDGDQETRNIAAVGDYIVTGLKGERYVIKAATFPNLYEEDPGDPTRYRSKSAVRALELMEPVAIRAPWGEIQRTGTGGFICQSLADANDVYLIEADVFEATYAPEPQSMRRATA